MNKNNAKTKCYILQRQLRSLMLQSSAIVIMYQQAETVFINARFHQALGYTANYQAHAQGLSA